MPLTPASLSASVDAPSSLKPAQAKACLSQLKSTYSADRPLITYVDFLDSVSNYYLTLLFPQAPFLPFCLP